MENFPIRQLTLIEEEPQVSATSVILATLKRLLNQGYQCLAVAVLGDTLQLNQWFEASSLNSVRVISIDPQELDQLSETLRSELSSQPPTDKQLVFISSADSLLRFLGVDKAIRQLHSLSRNFPIITRVFHDAWADLDLKRLYSISTNVLRIRVDQKRLCICETKVEKKDGLFGRKIEQFTVDPTTLQIRSQAYEPPSKYPIVVNEEEPKSGKDLLPKTTFDMGLNLTEEERKNKAATRLPFTHAQNEQGLVSLNINAGKKIRAGGQIIYTPDETDDLDDSDPDEDLMI
ncbi:Elongator complex protein 5 [Aphelenchoides bicaudatus]|nr:Elongator complex protein 5 [Aphelenchoides bicaudatus]